MNKRIISQMAVVALFLNQTQQVK